MYTLIAILILFVYIDAMYDATEYLYRTTKKYMQRFNNLKTLLLVFTLFTGSIIGMLIAGRQWTMSADLGNLVKIMCSYLLFRFAIFNIVFNVYAGLDWWYLGTTKWLDRFEKWVANKLRVNQSVLFIILRIIAFSVAFHQLYYY